MHRFSDICHLSEKGENKVCNEDLAFVEKNLVVLLSGTLRDSPHDVMCPKRTDTKWFVDEVCRILREQYHTTTFFLDALKAAIDTASFRYVHKSNRLTSNPYSISDSELPSSSMCAITIEEGDVIAYMIGDCDLLLKQDSGRRITRVDASGQDPADRAADRLSTDIRSTHNVVRRNLTEIYKAMPGDELLTCSRGLSRMYHEQCVVTQECMFSKEPHVLMHQLKEHHHRDGTHRELDATMIRWVIA